VTFLGRGGSDITAVALAQALGAGACELYTDVSGVFSADPRVVPDARKLHRLSFEEMLEMCASGCPKPEMRSVEYARNHRVRLHVRSSFTWEPGTWVEEEDPTVEQPIISAVTSDTSEAKLTVTGVPDQPGIAARLFRALIADRGIATVSLVGAGMKTHAGVSATMFETLADAGINIEMISTSAIRITCVIREELVDKAVAALHEAFKLDAE
jgi:aspartate kinase